MKPSPRPPTRVLALVLVVGSVLPASAAVPGALAPPLKLRLKLRPRDLFVTQMTVVGRGQGIITGGPSKPLSFSLAVEHERWVERVLPNGNAVVQDRMRGGRVVLNNIPQKLPATQRVVLEVTPLGKVVKVDQARIDITRAMVDSNFSPGSFADLTNFPLQPVRLGQVWQVRSPFQIPGLLSAELRMRTAFRGQSVVRGQECALLSTAFQVPLQVALQEQKMKVRIHGRVQGQMQSHTSLATGMPVETSGKLRLSVSGMTTGERNPLFPVSGLISLQVSFGSKLVSYVPGSQDRLLASSPRPSAPLAAAPVDLPAALRAPMPSGSTPDSRRLPGPFSALDMARDLKRDVEAIQRERAAALAAQSSGGTPASPAPASPMPSVGGTPTAGPGQVPSGPTGAAPASTPRAAAGSGSAEAPSQEGTVPPPTSPPEAPVRLLNYHEGDSVSGQVTLQAFVPDPQAKPFVVFVIDGVKRYVTNRLPYRLRWDTRLVTEGPHEVSVWLVAAGGEVLYRSPALRLEVVRGSDTAAPLPQHPGDRVALAGH